MMDDRAVSVAVTHTLTLGITAILITAMLVASGTMMDFERDRGASDSLETIGERLAGEVSSVDRLGSAQTETLEIYTTHPREIAGSPYTATLTNQSQSDTCADSGLTTSTETCIVMESPEVSDPVVVPLATDADVAQSSAGSGGMLIEYNATADEITIDND